MMKGLVAGVIAVAIGVVGAARAADKPEDIVAGRQAAYDLMGGVASAMKGAVDSGASVKPLVDGAKGIVSWSHVIPVMFPVGTETGHNTKAKPEIWSDAAGFAKAAANLGSAAEKLVVLAEADDKAGFAAQFKELGATCGACHRAYRAR